MIRDCTVCAIKSEETLSATIIYSSFVHKPKRPSIGYYHHIFIVVVTTSCLILKLRIALPKIQAEQNAMVKTLLDI